MKSCPLPQDYPVTDRPLVPIHSITTNAWLTLTTAVLSWETLMRRILRASWMTTSVESWRPPAANRPAPAVTRPSHARQKGSLGPKGVGLDRPFPLARVNIHPGTLSGVRPATCTTTNMFTTSTTENWWSRRCVCTVASITEADQSAAATPTARDLAPQSMLGKALWLF